MSPVELFALLGSGVVAGAINAVVGSGSLITFPVLVLFGLPPVVANVTNAVGVLPASVAAAFAQRKEFRGESARLVAGLSFSAAGGVVGALLLLRLPSAAFDAIVPSLILLALVLVLAGPRLKRWASRRRQGDERDHRGTVYLSAGLTGIYGGYFGAAQGVLLMAVLGIGVADSLQRHNATKNVLAMLVNGIAAVVFIAVADVDWTVAGLIAAGSIVGGQIGAGVCRRLPAPVLRAVIVAVGLTALVVFLTR